MPPKLKISLLGGLSIRKGTKPIVGLPSRAAEALLLYLALNKRPLSREKLAELLWADRTTTQALTNLRTILTSLRKEVGDYLIIERDTLAINPESSIWLDVNEFESRITELGLLDHNIVPSNPADAQKLQQVLELYQGDFLEGFYLRDGQGFEEWMILQRERLKHFAREGFRLLTHYHHAEGHYAQGILSAARWQNLDPYDEDACRSQMTLLLRTGQRNAALQSYQNLKDKLQKDLGVTPSFATTELFQKFQQADFPPKMNLPIYSTNFLGRKKDIQDIVSLLASKEARLITIVGPGGIGKTRLAIESARSLVERKPGRFLHGVAFISLATVTSPLEIPIRIAETIDLKIQGQDSVQKQLLDFLQGREILFVLDNLEHLLDGAGNSVALIVDILRNAPDVKILLTSRERINLYNEVVFDVSGLDVPEEDSPVTEKFSAVELFFQGAKRVQREYLPSPSERMAIVQICRMVNGMPLAIELASAWIRDYSSIQIVQQIEKELDFLSSSYKDVPIGHSSFRKVFERSWLLLSQQEQSMFLSLSVFRGGFTLEAARAVIKVEFLSMGLEVETMLSNLVDKSLVQHQTDGRFDIHPLIGQFVFEKLSASKSDLEAASASHAFYYLKFLSDLGDGESPQNRALIYPERDNIRLSWEYAAVSGLINELERSAGILHGFYSMQSLFQEGIDLFQRVINIIVENKLIDMNNLLPELLGRKARMHTQIGQLELARSASRQALSYLEDTDDPARRSRVLDSLAITSYYAGDYQQATELAEQSLMLSQKIENRDGIAFALNFLGSCAKAQGKYDECRNYFERAVNAYHDIHDEVGAAMVLNNLGNLLQLLEDFAGSQEYYLQGSVIFKAQDHVHGAATTLANAGKLAGKQGNHQLAGELLRESLALKRKINDQRGEAVALAGLGDVALSIGDLTEARNNYKIALSMAVKVGDVQLLLDTLAAIVLLLNKTGRMDLLHHRLLSYVLNHSGTSQEAQQRVINLKDKLTSKHEDKLLWDLETPENVANFTLNEL